VLKTSDHALEGRGRRSGVEEERRPVGNVSSRSRLRESLLRPKKLADELRRKLTETSGGDLEVRRREKVSIGRTREESEEEKDERRWQS